MHFKIVTLHIIISTIFLPLVVGIEPISGVYAIGAAIASLGLASYRIVLCRFKECCDDRWIVNNITGLNEQLDRRLYGQHLVRKAVSSHLQAHVRSLHPSKALALSFHGPTGTGKNHVSRIIAEALYKEGMKSANVLLLSVTMEFPHNQMVELYKDILRDKIEKQISKCPRSLIIFDEIDKMPEGLIDTIKPYLDYHESLGGVDYRNAIFIFLSNAGGTAITDYLLQQWRDGVKREEIKLMDVEKILAKAAINSESEGGLYHSELISKHLITAFLPFLPLERKYVRQCIRDIMVSRKYYLTPTAVPESKVEEVLLELLFYPEKEGLFSVTGCKRVSEKVDYVMLG